MHIIEKTWVDLHAGYEEILSLEKRLKTDWKRALQVVQKRDDRSVKSRIDRTRKITGYLLLALLFAFILFCAGIYYLPELRLQLFVFFCMLGIPVIILGLVLTRIFGGADGTLPGTPPSMEIEQAWWKRLKPKHFAGQRSGDRGEIDFLQSLAFLDDSYVAVWGLLTAEKIRSDTDVLLLGPNGIWIFEVKYWKGTVFKQNGSWYTVPWHGKGKTDQRSPDEQWLQQKEEISKTIRIQLPNVSWQAELIQGGVVFAHQNSRIGQIDHPQADCGKPRAWHKRINDTKPLKDFTLSRRLQILDALTQYANRHEREELTITSARDAANELYDQAVSSLQSYVSERLKLK